MRGRQLDKLHGDSVGSGLAAFWRRQSRSNVALAKTSCVLYALLCRIRAMAWHHVKPHGGQPWNALVHKLGAGMVHDNSVPCMIVPHLGSQWEHAEWPHFAVATRDELRASPSPIPPYHTHTHTHHTTFSLTHTEIRYPHLIITLALDGEFLAVVVPVECSDPDAKPSINILETTFATPHALTLGGGQYQDGGCSVEARSGYCIAYDWMVIISDAASPGIGHGALGRAGSANAWPEVVGRNALPTCLQWPYAEARLGVRGVDRSLANHPARGW